MGLKKTVNSLDDVEERYRDLYKKDEDLDTYVFVGLEGDLDPEITKWRGKVSEFRTNNVALKGDLEKAREVAARFKDVDPEVVAKAQKMMEAAAEEEERKLLEAGDIDGVVERRTGKMTAAHKRELAARQEAFDNLQAERNTLRDQLSTFTIDAEVRREIGRVAKIRKGAEDDVLARARRTWHLNDEGAPTPDAGGKMEFGEDGKQLTIEGWAQQVIKEAPHLFEPGGGGGGDGDGDKNLQRMAGGKKVVSADDPLEFGRNLDAIADGKVSVE